MRDHIDLPVRHRIDFAKHLSRQFAHHHNAIGKLCNLFEHNSLICVRLAQHRVQRSHQRHFQSPQQRQHMAPGGAAIDAVFVLQADEIVAIEVEEIRRSLVRCNVLLFKFQPYFARIFVTRVRIVNGNCEQALVAIFGPQSAA